ncbi:MAG: Gfo/Idh/MocA family oxidoreductase [Chloroflexi bacterium]|nr:Gfo/Idh/MocA family oxidoreductase [Chloroflexota bacterium]
MAQHVNVALIGYRFMGKSHSNAYRQVAHFFPQVGAVPEMKVLCGRDRAAVAEAAQQLGWQEVNTDWRAVVRRSDIDLVDIVTPGNAHADIAIAAAQAGKHVFCEKPLANTVAEAERMVEAVEKAGVRNMVAFNYRRVPAVAYARQLIEEGRIGRIYHFRARYLQDWIMDPDFPLVWRLDKGAAGSGPMGDLGAHIIDLAHYLIGDFDEVTGMAETFIKERPLLAATDSGLGASGGTTKGQVTVEDAAAFVARFTSGAMGVFEVTRFAGGNKNANTFEINGSKGSIRFNLERLDELEFLDLTVPSTEQGFRTILITDGAHPYMAAWWPAGHIIGWEHTFTHEVLDLLNAIASSSAVAPDFRDGLRVQYVLDAVDRACASHRWERVTR